MGYHSKIIFIIIFIILNRLEGECQNRDWSSYEMFGKSVSLNLEKAIVLYNSDSLVKLSYYCYKTEQSQTTELKKICNKNQSKIRDKSVENLIGEWQLSSSGTNWKIEKTKANYQLQIQKNEIIEYHSLNPIKSYKYSLKNEQYWVDYSFYNILTVTDEQSNEQWDLISEDFSTDLRRFKKDSLICGKYLEGFIKKK